MEEYRPEVNSYHICPCCDGSGFSKDNPDGECLRCFGSGKVRNEYHSEERRKIRYV